MVIEPAFSFTSNIGDFRVTVGSATPSDAQARRHAKATRQEHCGRWLRMQRSMPNGVGNIAALLPKEVKRRRQATNGLRRRAERPRLTLTERTRGCQMKSKKDERPPRPAHPSLRAEREGLGCRCALHHLSDYHTGISVPSSVVHVASVATWRDGRCSFNARKFASAAGVFTWDVDPSADDCCRAQFNGLLLLTFFAWRRPQVTARQCFSSTRKLPVRFARRTRAGELASWRVGTCLAATSPAVIQIT